MIRLHHLPALLWSILGMATMGVQEVRYFTGPFRTSEALKLIFGNYDSAKHTAVWNDPKSQVPDFEATSGIIKPSFESGFSEGGVQKHLRVTATIPTSDYTCHACSPVTSVFVFAIHDGKWVPEIEAYDVKVRGFWGKPPSSKLIKVGPERYGLLLSVSDMAQGYSSSSDSILVPISNGMSVPLSITTDANNRGACGDDVSPAQPCYRTHHSYAFTSGKNPAFYDLIVTESGTKALRPGQVVPARGIKRYSFVDGKYVAVP